MFRKEKMYLGSFCRGMLGEIIASSQYLDFDNSGHFTQIEKEEIYKALKHFKVLCVMIKIMEKSMMGKIKKDSEEIGRLFMQALKLSYEDNGIIDGAEIDEFSNLLQEYFSYIDGIEEGSLEEKGFGFYACVFISEKLIPSRKNEKDVTRFGRIYEIAVFLFKGLDKYFEDVYKKVILIDA